LINSAAIRVGNGTPVFNVKIDVNNLKISIKDVCSRMSNGTQSLDAHFYEIINEIFAHLSEKCRIRAGYVICPADFNLTSNRKSKVGNIHFNMGKIVTSQLKNAVQMAVFACTIGPDMENWSRHSMEQDNPAESYLIDRTASVLTEKAVDYLHEYIGGEMAKQNLLITNRYSPGYCDWPVSDQHLLFSLFPHNFCGIRLNASALMHPIKSVSGVIGIGPDVEFKEYMCNRCRIKECTYRRKHVKNTNTIIRGIAL